MTEKKKKKKDAGFNSGVNVYFHEMKTCSLNWVFLFCLQKGVSYFKGIFSLAKIEAVMSGQKSS